MSDRIHNFGAGPGVLPEPVLQKARQDIWNIGGSGIGILEHSHRGKLFERILAETIDEARRLAEIPDRYKVLFVQGGATQQFAMVPMNLLPAARTADYLVTGVWAEKGKTPNSINRQLHSFKRHARHWQRNKLHQCNTYRNNKSNHRNQRSRNNHALNTSKH